VIPSGFTSLARVETRATGKVAKITCGPYGNRRGNRTIEKFTQCNEQKSASSASAATAGAKCLRLCATHPQFQVVYVAGESSAGQKLIETLSWNAGCLVRSDDSKMGTRRSSGNGGAVCFPSSGESKEALVKVSAKTRIVDIGGDHRFVEGWTYGLADVWPEQIRKASRVANPGCYPAASLGALAPLVAKKLIDPSSIIIDAKSGVSGAGRGGREQHLDMRR